MFAEGKFQLDAAKEKALSGHMLQAQLYESHYQTQGAPRGCRWEGLLLSGAAAGRGCCFEGLLL